MNVINLMFKVAIISLFLVALSIISGQGGPTFDSYAMGSYITLY